MVFLKKRRVAPALDVPRTLVPLPRGQFTPKEHRELAEARAQTGGDPTADALYIQNQISFSDCRP